MLEHIKSVYIVKLIFSFLKNKHILSLIQFSQKYQLKLEYTLDDFKKVSGKIKIGEKNGKGQEYKDKKLVFEGTYFNYKRHGFGKEFENDKLIFKGEYLEGKRNGRGYEYEYLNNKQYLIFEGEYQKGKKNGKGTIYYDNKNIKFTGEFINGKIFNGRGYDYIGKEEYEIINGNGNIIERNLFGKMTFDGCYQNGERNGKGKEYQFEMLIFEGEYLNGKRNGKGCEYECDYKDGSKEVSKKYFEGEYKNGFRINGKEFNADGKTIFEGFYLNNERSNGKEYKEEDGSIIFEGEYLNGQRWTGKGVEYDNKKYNNEKIFEGDYLKGQRWNGKGKEYNIFDKLIFEGEYLNGKKNGPGKEYDSKERILFDGEYRNGEKWKGNEKNITMMKCIIMLIISMV